MQILFDQGTPVPLRPRLKSYSIVTAFELGWSDLQNGELLSKAQGRFDLLMTTDQSIPHQQQLSQFEISVLILPTTRWPEIEQHVEEIQKAIEEMKPNEARVLTW